MNVRHSQRLLQPTLREKVVYANDLSEGSGSPTLTSVGLSPVWQLDAQGNSHVLGDLKIPIDRVPGTPIDVKIVFTVNAGGGYGYILLNFDYIVVSEGSNIALGDVMPGLVVTVPAANLQKTTAPIRIASSRLDGLISSADIQFAVQREQLNDADTYGGNVLILKVVFEYYAYD